MHEVSTREEHNKSLILHINLTCIPTILHTIIVKRKQVAVVSPEAPCLSTL